MKRNLLLLTLLLFIGVSESISQDTCWTVLLVKKGKKVKVRKNMDAFSNRGFYLYRNCIYNVSTKKGKMYKGRLIDIKPDTLFFTKYLNATVAKKWGENLDTVAIHYRQLDKLYLFRGMSRPTYKLVSLENFNFSFKKDTTHCRWESLWGKIFTGSDKVYEIVPHMEMQGITGLYEYAGTTYFFSGGGITKPDTSKIDTVYRVKNFFGLLPTKADKINGLAIGAIASNIKKTKKNEFVPLKVNGLCIELFPFMGLGLIGLDESKADTIDLNKDSQKNNKQNVVNGVSLSFDKLGVGRVNGLQVSFAFTWIKEAHGVCISGIRNFAYKLNGVGIASMNKAIRAKGVQIGLYNKANDLRGFQFGLWNVNGRRSLPFINWQFRKKKKRRKNNKRKDRTGK